MFLQGVLKNEFGQVYEAIFKGVKSPCELIFCILGIEKGDLDEITCKVLNRRMAL
jgi:hypothetical protein